MIESPAEASRSVKHPAKLDGAARLECKRSPRCRWGWLHAISGSVAIADRVLAPMKILLIARGQAARGRPAHCPCRFTARRAAPVVALPLSAVPSWRLALP